MSDRPSEREYEAAKARGAEQRRNGAREGACPYRGSTAKVRILAEAWLMGFQDQDREIKAQKARR